MHQFPWVNRQWSAIIDFLNTKSINIRVTITHQAIKPISMFNIHTVRMPLILVFDCSNICAFWVLDSASTYSDGEGCYELPRVHFTWNGAPEDDTFDYFFTMVFLMQSWWLFSFIRPTFDRFRNQVAFTERVFPGKLSHDVLPSAYVFPFF